MRNDDNELQYSEPAPAFDATDAASSRHDSYALLERFDKLVDPLLADAHAQAFELVVDDGSVMDESKPIRVAVYRSLRTLRSEEKALRRRFVSTLRNRLGALLDRDGDSAAPQAEAPVRLALMSDDQLDEAVLCASLAIPSEKLFDSRLSALAIGLQHAGYMVGEQDLQALLGPRPVLETYLGVLSGYEVEPEIKVAILRAVEGHFLPRLGDALEELRRIADPNGVAPLPSSAGHARRLAAGGGNGNTVAATGVGGRASDAHVGAGGLDEETGSRVVTDLLNLLAGRAKSEGRTGHLPQSWSLEQVLDALAEAQAMLHYRPADCGFDVEGDLSDQLGRFLAARTDGSALQLSETHTAIADLVELVFQLVISADQPAARQRLLKLKVPYLRVALSDRRLFISKAHAARRLLEELAGLASRAGHDEERREELESIERAVHEIMTSFDGDVEQLRAVLASMQGQRETLEARQRAKEGRVVRTAEGKERLRLAWKSAHAVVAAARHERHPARIVELFLERPWAQYLVLLELRGQRDTETWTDALRAMGSLVTLTDVEARVRASDGARLSAQQVLQIVRQGLTLVGYNEFDILQLWRCFTRAIVARPGSPCDEPDDVARVIPIGLTLQTARSELALDAIELGAGDESDVGAAEPVSAVAANSHDEASASDVAALHVGDWVDIHDDQGAVVRAKLCWRGIASGQSIFVNRAGVKILEISQRDLECRQRLGQIVARPVPASVDGAIASIFSRLQGNLAHAS